MNKLMYRFVATRKKKKKKKKKKKRNRPVFRHGMPLQGILRKKEKKEIDPFLDTVCPLRASRVKKKEIDPFLDTVCPFRASRVKRNLPVFRHGMPPQGIPRKKKSTRFKTRYAPSGHPA